MMQNREDKDKTKQNEKSDNTVTHQKTRQTMIQTDLCLGGSHAIYYLQKQG